MSKQTGKQCGNFATPGMNVCRFHGGRSPDAIAKAKERIAELLPKAVTTMEKAMDQRMHWPTALNAARHIADRVIGPVEGSEKGGKPTINVVVGVNLPGSDVKSLPEPYIDVVSEPLTKD